MATKAKARKAKTKKAKTKKVTARPKAARKSTTKKKATKKTAAKKKTAKRNTTKRKTTKRKTANRKTTKKKTAKRKATKTTTKRRPVARKKPPRSRIAAKKKKAPKKAVAKVADNRNYIEPPKRPVLTQPKNSNTKQYTQSELYQCLTEYCGFSSKKHAKEFYAQFTDMIQGALKNGYRVVLPGLGKIQVRRSKARMGINPQTREPIRIPARKRVRFTPNKALKDAVL